MGEWMNSLDEKFDANWGQFSFVSCVGIRKGVALRSISCTTDGYAQSGAWLRVKLPPAHSCSLCDGLSGTGAE